MPHRLLTWLFLTATVVADAALFGLAMNNPQEMHYQSLLQGMALGQVGALAIWTVVGRWHRLARGACLVLGTGALAFITIRQQDWYAQKWLAVLGVYAIVVVAVVALVTFARRTIANKGRNGDVVRTPLIELFGWTIVAAIASFGARYMNFQVLESGLAKLPTTLALLAVPVAAELLYRPLFKPMHLLKWLALVAVVGAIGYYLESRRVTTLGFATQAAYLAVWMIVRELEGREPPSEVVKEGDVDEPPPSGPK